MLTGKNLEKFNKWLENYSEKDQSLMNKELDIYPDEIFHKLPFEMQLGLYLAYFDEIGIVIHINPTYKSFVKQAKPYIASLDKYINLKYDNEPNHKTKI